MDYKRKVQGYVSTSHKMILFCKDSCCQMRICVNIKGDKRCEVTSDSKLQHCENCMSTADCPDRQELLANQAFVDAAIGIIGKKDVFKNMERLVHQYFKSTIKPALCTKLCDDLRERSAMDGFKQGFTGVRHLLQAFQDENPGCIFKIEVDDEDRFTCLVLVPAQAFDIVRNSARTYFALDAGFSLYKAWKGLIFVLVWSDGNNCNIPIAIGIYNSESFLNYSHFLKTIMSAGNGDLGSLMNRPFTVVCTDRARAFEPAMKVCLPLAHHRYDVFHIIQNMHDKGWKNCDIHMLNCHKAVSRGDFDICWAAWKKAHSPSATYAYKIDHTKWTTYTAVSPAPFRLFRLTGSQAVESEMSRMKRLNVRHELPLKAMNNFINFYADLISKQRASCDKMEAARSDLTQHANMVTRENFDEARNFDVRHTGGHTYEVTRRGQNQRHRKVQWGVKLCSCEKTALEGIPCEHLIAVYIKATAKEKIGPETFLKTFENIIPYCYRTKFYVKGYATYVHKAILTFIEDAEDVLPPCEAQRAGAGTRGPLRKKRLLGPSERGFAAVGVTVKGKPYKKTKQNMKDKNLEDALDAAAKEPERSMRSADVDEQAVAARAEAEAERGWLGLTDMVLGYLPKF
jgi:hypothetical protein